MQGQGVTTPTVLRSGDYTPNSEANWWNTDDSPHKQNVIKRGLGYGQNYSVNTIDPYTEFEREGKNWLTGETALNKLESHGLSHNEIKHPSIKPIGHMRWHAAIPGYIGKKNTHLTPRPSSGATSSFNKVDPESTLGGYQDANFYNISLPYYKAPVQKYILDEPPVVNTTLTTIPKPIPRTEASFERERKRHETEDLMEELTKLGLYTGPIRGRGADENKEWQEALAKYENKEAINSTPKTLKKPKEIKELKTPEGYTLKTGYRGRDGIYYGNKYLPTTSKGKTHPVPGAPTMQDYWIKYPNERPKDKDLVSKQIGGELPKAKLGKFLKYLKPKPVPNPVSKILKQSTIDEFLNAGIAKSIDQSTIDKFLKGTSTGFKSNIDWENWVKYKEDFHNNPDVIKHLNEIEEVTKANKTWMKNADGSSFERTPEEFVIERSDLFKKAFPDIMKKDGKVMPLIHHSRNEFNSFDEKSSLV